MRKIYAEFALASLLMLVIAFTPLITTGQSKPEANRSKEIINDRIAITKMQGNTRVDAQSGIPYTVYSPNFKATGATPAEMARQYLNEKADMLTPYSKSEDIQHIRTMETPGGYKVHFRQFAEGYPVYGSSITVSINRKDEVVFVANNYKPVKDVTTDMTVTEAGALDIAVTYLDITGTLAHESVETVVFNTDRQHSVLAYQVSLVPAEDIFGDWELIIDAGTGDILRAEDKACYYHPRTDSVTGSAWVFDPDPVTNAAAVYGDEGFEDNNDAEGDSLTAQLKEVELKDIYFDGTTYYLEGPNAVIIDVEAPFTGTFEQDSANFYHNRSNPAFEAALIYYHVDQNMRYLNDSLGFDVEPFQYEGGVQFDPHGFNNAVNAHYVGSAGFISFGSPESGVDLGEDHAVVLHELGHGIHDWITNGELSQVNGLSEGLSDFWAQSYTRSLGKYQPGDEGYDWFGVWGGQPNWGGPSLRRTDVDAHFPEDLVGQVHTDGQMWSSSLMAIYDVIGKEATDKNHWEAISMLNGGSGQVDAAIAFIQADKELYGGEHLETIVDVFTERGYITGSLFIEFEADTTGGMGPLTVNFEDNSTSFLGDIVSWEWDFDGDGVIDSYEQNPSHTYTEVGSYTVGLRVSDGNVTTSLVKPNHITVNGGFFVFETSENQRDHSGTFQRDFLQANGFDVVYGNTFPSSLAGFDACFISMGNYNSGDTPLTNEMASVLIKYLEDGGKVYLESGDALGYYQNNNQQLRDLFGLSSAEDGNNSNEIDLLEGRDDALTAGMVFNGSNQTASGWIDRFYPNSDTNSRVAFVEGGYGNVAVQYSGEFDQQTFCFSYAMAELKDNDAASSKYNLMVQILNFFGYPLGSGGLVANFQTDKTSVLPGEEMLFSDWSVSDTADPITSWKWDLNGDGTIDSEEQNPVMTYTEGGMYDVMLVVSNSMDTDTVVKSQAVAVRSGILVYEGKSVSGYSGDYINDFLHEYSYEEISYTHKMPEVLEGYDVILLSFGNSGNQETEMTQPMASAINAYGFDGGRIYLEGGDVLSDNPELWTLFGVLDIDNGQSNMISSLTGHDEAITYGLQFDASSQFSVNSIDAYTPIEDPAIAAAFTEDEYGVVAIQRDGAATTGHKAFAFSYAIADLEDGDGMNTRDELLLRILNFFDIVSDVAENQITANSTIKVYPNPAVSQVTLQFESPEEALADVMLYDLSGRMISGEKMSVDRGVNRLNFQVENLPDGIYYFNVRSDVSNETVKWLKLK
ncbi:MAG: PKD domain-containing protein [bacterium]